MSSKARILNLVQLDAKDQIFILKTITEGASFIEREGTQPHRMFIHLGYHGARKKKQNHMNWKASFERERGRERDGDGGDKPKTTAKFPPGGPGHANKVQCNVFKEGFGFLGNHTLI